MMLIPRRNFDLFNDLFSDEFFTRKEINLMKTDIREEDDKYIVEIDLPGFSKEDIKLSLENSILEIAAKKETSEESDRKYIHRERFTEECTRSFMVDDNITEKDINAAFKDGILTVEIAKKEEKKAESKTIEIK